MFYNTGISTYVWIVTNRKPAERAGTVTLVDARELGTKMRKSLGDKRKELTRDAIDEIARLFRDAVELNGADVRVKVMHNQDFGFARLTVERPMRRTWRVDETTTAALSPELSSAVAPLLGKSWPDEKHARIAVSACGSELRAGSASSCGRDIRAPPASSAASRTAGEAGGRLRLPSTFRAAAGIRTARHDSGRRVRQRRRFAVGQPAGGGRHAASRRTSSARSRCSWPVGRRVHAAAPP